MLCSTLRIHLSLSLSLPLSLVLPPTPLSLSLAVYLFLSVSIRQHLSLFSFCFFSPPGILMWLMPLPPSPSPFLTLPPSLFPPLSRSLALSLCIYSPASLDLFSFCYFSSVLSFISLLLAVFVIHVRLAFGRRD